MTTDLVPEPDTAAAAVDVVPTPPTLDVVLAPSRTLGAPVTTSDGAQPRHLAIRGDNLAAAAALHDLDGRADIIYLDPPYNTGGKNVTRYQDSYLDDWVEMMRPRLAAAHRLLKPTGVVMVAIGDDEHHRLRVLLDEVFGASQFISNVVWHGSVRSDSRWVSNGAEYMLIYARSRHALKASGVRWREPRDGVSEILAAADRACAAVPALHTRGARKGEPLSPSERAERATRLLKGWQRALSKEHPAMSKGLRDYNKIDERGDVFRYGPVAKPVPGGYHYPVAHPATGRPVATPRNGWRMPAERMAAMVAADDVCFGPDEAVPLRGKLRLKTLTDQVPRSVFESRRSRGAAHLREILGPDEAGAAFPFPKDHEVLMRWIGLAAPRDALVVDLFAGSGSTGEAVLRLNADDAATCAATPADPTDEVPCTCGSRRFVLVTNNEVEPDVATRLRSEGHRPGEATWESHGVFEQILVPRLRALVEGQRPDGSSYAETTPGCVDVVEMP